MSAYLILVLCGFVAFMATVAYGMIQTARADREAKVQRKPEPVPAVQRHAPRRAA